MIYALEGPDRCGKSTLFNALKFVLPRAVFVPRLPLTASLFLVLREVEIRNEALWRALHDDSKTYVCDRHFAVSDQVYSRLHGRPLADYSWWLKRVRPVYLQVPEQELRRRHLATGDEFFDADRYAEVCLLYEDVLRQFSCITLDGTKGTAGLVIDLLKELA